MKDLRKRRQQRRLELGKHNSPWGWQILWAKTPHYAGKILHITRGRKLSLQYHMKKWETILVLQGKLTLWLKGYKQSLREGDSYDIPPGTIHRFEAKHGDVDLVEVSTNHLDDVIRLQDDFGRV